MVISDGVTRRTILRADPMPPVPQWRFSLIPIPAGTNSVTLEAVDPAATPGEWQAFATPRRLGRLH